MQKQQNLQSTLLIGYFYSDMAGNHVWHPACYMGSAWEVSLNPAGNTALGVREMIGHLITTCKGDTTQSTQ